MMPTPYLSEKVVQAHHSDLLRETSLRAPSRVVPGHGWPGNTMPLKEVFDQPDAMWLQFRRRLDKLYSFCRVAGHSGEEVREILAALETVYREPFPQLNLRQWSGAIHTWLTHPVLDPTNSGRVVMDSVMKLVTTALEWSYAAGETDVRAETLGDSTPVLMIGA